jgi:hypothetical protein
MLSLGDLGRCGASEGSGNGAFAQALAASLSTARFHGAMSSLLHAGVGQDKSRTMRVAAVGWV